MAKEKAKKAETKYAWVELKFSKGIFLQSERFKGNHDILVAVLEDDVQYTIPEVEEKISKYLKGKVN